MKIVVMSDPHLGKFWKINNSMSNRAEKLYNCFLQNLELNADNETVLVIAGDVYDSIHANVEMLIRFRKELDSIFSKYKDVRIIAGNHETFIDKHGNQQSLLELGLSNTSMVTSRGVSRFVVDNLVNLVLVPYQKNFVDVMKNIVSKYFDSNLPNILISHETPKEIFSYSKFSMSEIVDYYNQNCSSAKISMILLGHYHKPSSTNVLGVPIISIGNSYYHTLDDVRDFNNSNLQKRYIVLSNENIDSVFKSKKQRYRTLFNLNGLNVYSVKYNLPNVYEYDVDNQNQFNNEILPSIRESNKDDETSIFWIKSRNLIDYSQAMFEGCDIYFDFLKDNEESILSLDEATTTNVLESISAGKTLYDRWNSYLKNLNITDEQKKLASFLFEKRNDSDKTAEGIMNSMFLSIGGNDLVEE